MASVKRYRERERQGILWEQRRHYVAMIQAHETNLTAIVNKYREKLARVDRQLGITSDSEEIEKGAA